MTKRLSDLLEREVDLSAGVREVQQLLAQPKASEQALQGHIFAGMRVGTLVGLSDASEPLVTYPGQPGASALVARTTVDLVPDHVGQEVALAFENCDPLRPIITGRFRTARQKPFGDRPAPIEVEADGRRLTLTAGDRLVLKCGLASITLTAAGKVIVDGTYVSHRSRGVLRLLGGAVQIN
jgi:hypothetical protein